VNWSLANIGNAIANGPWTEQVLLATDAAGDNPTLLAALSYSGLLAVGSVRKPLSNRTDPQFGAWQLLAGRR